MIEYSKLAITPEQVMARYFRVSFSPDSPSVSHENPPVAGKADFAIKSSSEWASQKNASEPPDVAFIVVLLNMCQGLARRFMMNISWRGGWTAH